MKNLILIATFIFLFALSAQAQTNCTTIEDCQSKLSTAAQMINKLLDVNQSQAEVIKAKDAEIESRKQLDAINERLIERQKAEIADQNKLIVLLQKKTGRSFSVFFGLIKIRF